MKIRIKRLDKSLPLPQYHTPGSVAFDFAASADCEIPARALGFVPTGLIIETPPGYMLAIIARSSLAKKHGLMLGNAVGVIDQDYCGPDDEIRLMAYNITDAPVRVERGTRLAQGIFLPIQIAEWQEVDELAPQSRGGYGSTGQS